MWGLPPPAVHLAQRGTFDFAAAYDRDGAVELSLPESHAATAKHNVIMIEKAIGNMKRYLQLTTVIAAKQRANAHSVLRMSAKVDAGSPPNCQANIAANR